MTLPEAKSIARHLGLTLRLLRSGNYRVNFRDGDETTAYYTDDLEDAVSTAVEMARKQEVANAGAEAELVAQPMILAATNKYLAKSNKSRAGEQATKRRNAMSVGQRSTKMAELFVLVLWFFLCYTAGLYAKTKKGRNGYVYFVLALLFSPLVVWPVVELIPAKREATTT
jgi:hypothetical protein